ncbi:unnamed protein product [Bursaphelenchus xylophilus]|uniref:6-pyruvoyltetrahydropterin synthase n=1 Tax=Bursaphelenchus xylophilus TaxID=6326 RepID=A0A1I7RYD4_BURXY|nr:unnamed protein product [Bursaphelenchus xylophilus]CAG9085625.1 unnamed protein product [Bursaphelenchus xylophilus]
MVNRITSTDQIPAFVDRNIWKDSVIIHRQGDDIIWIRNNLLKKTTPSPSISSEDSGESSGSEGRKLRPKKVMNYFPPQRSLKTDIGDQKKKETTKESSEVSSNASKQEVGSKKRFNGKSASETGKSVLDSSQKSKKPKLLSAEEIARSCRPKSSQDASNSPLREEQIRLEFHIADWNLIRDQRDLNSQSTLNRPKVLPIVLPPERMKPIIAELVREESFSASHRLHNPNMSTVQNKKIFDKCNGNNGHGHNYRVKVFLKGPINNHTGMVYNMKDLKEEMKIVIDTLDHKNIDHDVVFFKTRVSTSENLAVYFVTFMKKVMAAPQLLYKIELWETDKNSVVLFASDV